MLVGSCWRVALTCTSDWTRGMTGALCAGLGGVAALGGAAASGGATLAGWWLASVALSEIASVDAESDGAGECKSCAGSGTAAAHRPTRMEDRENSGATKPNEFITANASVPGCTGDLKCRQIGEGPVVITTTCQVGFGVVERVVLQDSARCAGAAPSQSSTSPSRADANLREEQDRVLSADESGDVRSDKYARRQYRVRVIS